MAMAMDMLCVRLWNETRPAGRDTGTGVVRCQEPKTGQQKVQLYYEDDPLCPSKYIIYLCPPPPPIVHITATCAAVPFITVNWITTLGASLKIGTVYVTI